MSKLWTPPVYGPKGLELQFYNGIFHIHDLHCGCKDPIIHILSQIAIQSGNTNLSLHQLKKLKCRLTGEDGAEEEEETITAGDLEQLFKEPFDAEDDDGEKDTG